MKQESWIRQKNKYPHRLSCGGYMKLGKVIITGKNTTTRRWGLHESWSQPISMITTWEVEEGSTKTKWRLDFKCLKISCWENCKLDLLCVCYVLFKLLWLLTMYILSCCVGFVGDVGAWRYLCSRTMTWCISRSNRNKGAWWACP